MTLPPADSASAPTHAPMLLPPPPPLDGFSHDEFQARRDALRAAHPYGIILVRGTGAGEGHVHGAPFRQNSDFFYLTGVDTPGALLVILPDDVPANAGNRDLTPEVREILYLPDRDHTREAWEGANLGPGDETEQATGIERALSAKGFSPALTGWLRRNPVVCTCVPFGEHAKFTSQFLKMREIAEWAPNVQYYDCGRTIGNMRRIKSPTEIDRIKQAIAITTEGQRAAYAVIADGIDRFEYEVDAAALQAFRSRGATCAFPTIAGSGQRGTVLHYESNDGRMRFGEMVVVDIGARVGHYCGDLTRTYPVGGEFSARQREVYNVVLEAHKRVVSQFKVGEETLKMLTDRTKEFLKSSILRGVDGVGKPLTMDTFMPHGVSHHLGLDVHDTGDADLPLEPGCVITVEPGVYIPSEGIGVRLEDDYLVTGTGLERLGPPLEKNADVIQAAMTQQFS